MTRLEVEAPDGVPEIGRGDDLATLLLQVVTPTDGDVVVVTSKAVSKAEGRMRHGNREDAIAAETVRVVARRGQTAIVRNHLGLTMAAAGVDNSNVPLGSIVLLPRDPDSSARVLREQLHHRIGANVAVVISDTAGRAWREGQTDIAIGAAGVQVFDDLRGSTDASGKPLSVTMPCVADELAGAAELVKGKSAGVPVAVVRGLGRLVGSLDLPGARSIQRPAERDLFRQGADEAYDDGYRAGFDEAQAESRSASASSD